MLDTKLMNCHNFFKKVKHDYQEDAAVMMQYTIRRWLKKIKVARKLAEEKQKEQAMKNKNNQKQQLNKNQTTVNTRNIGKNVNTTVQLNNKTTANNKGVSDQSSK